MQSFFSSFQFPDFVVYIVWLVTLLLLIFSKHKFDQPAQPLSGIKQVIFTVVVILLVGSYTFILGTAYYQAYFPDYRYDEIREQVDFHIYQPSYIPNGRKPITSYHLKNDLEISTNPQVRVVYSVPVEDVVNNNLVKPLSIVQTRVEPGYTIAQYHQALDQEGEENKSEISAMTVSKWPDTTAYLRKKPIGDTQLVELSLITPENILIIIFSLGEDPNELIKMAESLQ